MSKSSVACRFSILSLVGSASSVYLWTLTLPDIDYSPENIKSYSKRFTKFVKLARRKYSDFRVVRVYEFGEKKGRLHCHFVTPFRYSVKHLRRLSLRCGLGRIHVKSIPADFASYIAKYVSKRIENPFIRRAAKGLRRWACVGFDGSLVKDIICECKESIIAHSFYNIIKRHFSTHRATSSFLRRVMLKIKWDVDYWVHCCNDSDLFWSVFS